MVLFEEMKTSRFGCKACEESVCHALLS